MDDGAEMQFLRREQGKSGAQIIAGLLPEDGIGSDARAILTKTSVIENFAQQAVVFLHGTVEGRRKLGSFKACHGGVAITNSGNQSALTLPRCFFVSLL